jgi:glycogen(starch) synthase
MKIVIHSPAFPPQIGGLEEIARICAVGLTKLGHDVTVLCETPNDPPTSFPFRVLRKPSFAAAAKAARSCDAFLMFNMSLKALLLPLLFRKPLVICHQGWYGKDIGDVSFRARIKVWLSRLFAHNIACSSAVAEYISEPVEVIPNAYNDKLFRLRTEIPRDRDVLFVGRLVSDKGANLLLEAMGKLSNKGIRPTITITGSGPEEESLRQQVAALGLEAQTLFTGALRGEVLAETMNAHRVLVVPSIWAEPFGIVALEGIASGCHVVASRNGGLCDAVGPCGHLFSNGDVLELTQIVAALLMKTEDSRSEAPEAWKAHLKRHRSEGIAVLYEQALARSVSGRNHLENRADEVSR